MIFLKFIFFLFMALFVGVILIGFAFFKMLRRSTQRFQPEQRDEEVHVNGNTIIDNRPKEQRRKQVIGDDEGEYVDFTAADED
ncbi:DUF4834 domain-containing protein [Prevotella ihumii]|uniref:DUF4834 domain-containing protein n=1 Tax=Prevotella ihumii TaxID=1917878 RepID=UPI0009821343|nr:DUF4834 domain-containing protein [Prevotella ihumii]